MLVLIVQCLSPTSCGDDIGRVQWHHAFGPSIRSTATRPLYYNINKETVKGTVSQSTHGSVIELRSDFGSSTYYLSSEKERSPQSWTLATLRVRLHRMALAQARLRRTQVGGVIQKK